MNLHRPVTRPLAIGSVVEADHPDRPQVEAFIADIYRQRYGATLRQFLPQLLAYRDADGNLLAAVGLRCGFEGRLFVENYLDSSAEAAIAGNSRMPVSRSQLVEVGNFAARTPGDARALIVNLTGVLHRAGLRWVLFAATRQLRNAFARLQLRPIVLANADASRLRGDASDWGSYYASRPQVVYGDIAAGQAFLDTRERAGQAPANQPLEACAGANL